MKEIVKTDMLLFSVEVAPCILRRLEHLWVEKDVLELALELGLKASSG